MKSRDIGHKALMHWMSEVAKAALPFESRWTRAALRRVDPDLAGRLDDQRGLFDKACVTGEGDDIEAHGAAMCRGWAAAARAMEAAGEPDDAYQIGRDPKTGFTVAIGAQKAAANRVVELHGQPVAWFSPDEIAALMGGLEAMKRVTAIKRVWPGADVIDFYPGEPAKDESEVDADEDAA